MYTTPDVTKNYSHISISVFVVFHRASKFEDLQVIECTRSTRHTVLYHIAFSGNGMIGAHITHITSLQLYSSLFPLALYAVGCTSL